MTEEIQMEQHTIADSCLLATLERQRMSTSRRADQHTEERVRQQEGDDSITIRKHLFKQGPVRELLRILDAAYAEHKKLTAPWVDRGPRLLPGTMFEKYSQTMVEYKDTIDELVPKIVGNWDNLVSMDMNDRQRAGAKSIMPSEYPDSNDVARMFSVDWRVSPVPKDTDFRVEVPEYVKEKQRATLKHAVEGVRQDILGRMLEPTKRAIAKLQIEIGSKGSIFRDSLVENLQEALQQAEDLNVTGDVGLGDAIQKMRVVVHAHLGSADSLREQEQHRATAAKKLAELVGVFESQL
jgi:hypothetical protein